MKYQYSYACCIVLTIASFYVRIYVLLGTYSSFAQIILSPSTTGMKHSINANVCEEFVDALRQLGDDSECRAILVTGIGGAFCNGIDYTILANDTSADKQRKNAEALANGIKKLVKRVSYFHNFTSSIHRPKFRQNFNSRGRYARVARPAKRAERLLDLTKGCGLSCH